VQSHVKAYRKGHTTSIAVGASAPAAFHVKDDEQTGDALARWHEFCWGSGFDSSTWRSGIPLVIEASDQRSARDTVADR
jgi:hypothetical protein